MIAFYSLVECRNILDAREIHSQQQPTGGEFKQSQTAEAKLKTILWKDGDLKLSKK